MAFNIIDFKSNGLQFGGARPSLFSVAVTPPTQAILDSGSVQKFTFTAQASSLPEATLGSIDVPYFGRKIKIAGDRTFADWRVTVMNDEDFSVRSMFEKWSNSLNRMVSNTRQFDMNFENYKSVMDVYQYGKDGSIIRHYEIIGAFPTTIDAIDLNWDTQNQVETFNVTFAYDYWVPVEASGTLNSYASNI
jgi:hypothetical protein